MVKREISDDSYWLNDQSNLNESDSRSSTRGTRVKTQLRWDMQWEDADYWHHLSSALEVFHIS